MPVLIGGLRVLNANYKQAKHGVFTDRPETFINDFFIHLMNMKTEWKPVSESGDQFEGYDLKTGRLKWIATRVDLVFGSNSQLRALDKVCAYEDAQDKFIHDFIEAWSNVMNAGSF